MEMSKIFYIVLVYCSFSIIAFGQYYDELEFEHDSQLDINKWIEKNPQATKLKFSYMFDPNRLPDKLPYHPNIKELSLISCDLYNLSDWSDSLPNVEKIVVKFGNFNSPENSSLQPDEQIFNVLGNYKKIKEFDYIWPGFDVTLTGINKLRNLESLFVYNPGLKYISEDISKLKKLKSLEIEANHELSGGSYTALSEIESLEIFDYNFRDTLSNEGIYKLQQIHTLFLGWGIRVISQLDINRFPNLRNIEFYIESAEDIPESFTKAKYLRDICVYHWLPKPNKAKRLEEIEKTQQIYEKLKNIEATIKVIPRSY
jgi:hypothetical protein